MAVRPMFPHYAPKVKISEIPSCFQSPPSKLFKLTILMAGITPAAPPKPSLYQKFGMGFAKADQFGDAWDRDPNRINTHLQVSNCT